MIGKFITGKSFRGCLAYCLHDKQKAKPGEHLMKDRSEVIMYNHCGGTEKELLRQFNDVRQLNPKLAKPVLHIMLSLAPGEILGKDKLMELCEDCAREMSFANNQFVAILHKDTNQQHLHIVVNRVGFNKRTVSDSNSFKRTAEFCRKMELKHDLKQVLSPRPFLSNEERVLPRLDSRKENLKRHIQQTLQAVSGYREFENQMKALGYQVLKARGIAFIDDKQVRIKGSEVGFPLRKIEQIFELKQKLFKQQTFEQMARIKQPVNTGATSNNGEILQRKYVQHDQGGLSNLHQSLSFQYQKALNTLIFELMAPAQQQQEGVTPDWQREEMKKKKKKKRKHKL
jgi:hypothetical protein